MLCTLCASTSFPFCDDKNRKYFRCPECDLIFADRETRLLPNEEKAIYDYHENDPNDTQYRAFLSQLSEPLLEKLVPGMSGLDFGSGPGPVLHLMLEEQGMKMSIYDIFYAPAREQLDRQYDFVTSTEVVEHFYEPAATWPELVSLVKPNGWIGIMTSLFTQETAERFKLWNYKNDPTHVSFYTPKTMNWIATHFQLHLEVISNRIMLFKKG
ncbi:class I SAM-dependent methyltransferase [Idiomarina sp. HP20-50]|uniref:class I SAM-dependent methyltransferase n=1 Tax=Idiomarina sp. HP20-50 TaxID=3070813 RepID=UPI00294B5FD0|nr:class I SAM-dependent methyltransferase [Idiomarina sp. HP20-50]MDV6316417.1 class I SAM-dependent methyltransferase [Idiomarina sp. HP20-50]